MLINPSGASRSRGEGKSAYIILHPFLGESLHTKYPAQNKGFALNRTWGGFYFRERRFCVRLYCSNGMSAYAPAFFSTMWRTLRRASSKLGAAEGLVHIK